MTAFLLATTLLVAIVATASAVYVRRMQRAHPEPHWDWSALEDRLDQVVFPRGFLWGTATAHHQVEGAHTTNNWGRWERDSTPRIQHGDVSGDAADHWNRYREDIDRMADELGVDVFRLSLSWSRIEPEPGVFDEAAIAHYHDVFDHCHRRGITPMVTLHHFAHPGWFEDLGSFQHDDNIIHFERFSARVVQEYAAKVPLWCTFNEPNVFAVMGFGLGVFPPGHKSITTLISVIRNLCVAHTRVVEAIRRTPGADHVEVGMVHNIFQLEPYRRWSPLAWLVSRTADHLYNDSFLSFLQTGQLRVGWPRLARLTGLPIGIEEAIPGDRGDFVGLNYYSQLLIDLLAPTKPPFEVRTRPGQVVTDMPYTIYAEGLWRALHRISKVGLPIWVTECGIADAAEQGKRRTWIRRYLYALHRAMSEGIDVRGHLYWSLMDNFEWAEGYAMRFGLYAVDYTTQQRRLRPGAQAYIDAIRRSRGPETTPAQGAEDDVAVVILAAGKGTRMRSSLPKPLVELAGRGIVLRLLDAVSAAKLPRVTVVVGHGAEQVRAAVPEGVDTALQEVRDGTAGAVACAKEACRGAKEVVVLVGDSPLLTAESLQALLQHRRDTGAGVAFLTAKFPEHYPYARVIRSPKTGAVIGCVESRDCTPEQLAVPYYLTSHYVFEASLLWELLEDVQPHPTTQERYLTDVVAGAVDRGVAVEAKEIADWRELVGLNTPEEVAWAEGVWAERS